MSPPPSTTSPAAGPRFLTMAQVSEILNISNAQAYALVRSGSLRAIKIGGRGQWRIGAQDLEQYIEQAYRDTATFVAAHPLRTGDDQFDGELDNESGAQIDGQIDADEL